MLNVDYKKFITKNREKINNESFIITKNLLKKKTKPTFLKSEFFDC